MKKVEEFRQKCLPEFNQKNAEGAALVVATFVKGCVGFDRLSGEPVNECGNGWGYYDLGLQNENFVLKAKELGLDTLIMGIRDGEAIRNFLDVPENEQVVSVIAVGYGAKDVQMPKKKERFGDSEVLLKVPVHFGNESRDRSKNLKKCKE